MFNKIRCRVVVPLILLFATWNQACSAGDLPYPPTYFSKFRVNLGVAQTVAKNCDSLKIDEFYYYAAREVILNQLQKDGFSKTNWKSEMREVPIGLRDEPNITFYMKWGVRSDDPESYCRAGKMEIGQKSMIGKFLQPKP